jgi:hypothetical protein
MYYLEFDNLYLPPPHTLQPVEPPEGKQNPGAKLSREVFFNLWKYSSLVPGNGARKEAATR